MLLWCFTGRHFSEVDRSGVSLAIISLTRSVLIERGARPAHPFTHFSNHICLFFTWPGLRGWLLCAGSGAAALVLHWLPPQRHGAPQALGVLHWLVFHEQGLLRIEFWEALVLHRPVLQKRGRSHPARRSFSLCCRSRFTHFFNEFVAWLAHWMAGWLAICFADWLVGWLLRWLVGWLVGRLAGRPASWPAGWLAGWLVGW